MAEKNTGPTCALLVRVTPNASRSSVEISTDGQVKVRVTTPPVEGRANKAVLKVLAKALGLPPSALRILRGQSSREKLIEVNGLDETAARSILAGG